MLTLVEGTAGAGKTIFVVERYIVPELENAEGRKIITNIPLDMDYIASVYGQHVRQQVFVMDIPFDDIASYQNSSGEFLIGYHFIIDECQEHYTKDQFDDTEVSKYFSRHRKYYCDITFLTQNPNLISRKLRGTVEICHYLVKRRVIGGTGYTLKTYAGKSSRGRPTNTVDGEYNPALFNYYRSYTAEGLGLKEMAQVKAPWSVRLLVASSKYLAPLFILVVTLAFVFIWRGFKHGSKPEKQVAAQSAPAPSRPDPAKPPVPPASPPPAPAPRPVSPAPEKKPQSPSEYPGRLASEVCDGESHLCSATIYGDDGMKYSTTELLYMGHKVVRLARLVWSVDGVVVTSHHVQPEAKVATADVPISAPIDAAIGKALNSSTD